MSGVRAIRRWDTGRALGMKVQINTTVARHNLHDLPDIVRLVVEHGAMLWSAFFLVPTGRGRQLGLLSPAEPDPFDREVMREAGPQFCHHQRRPVSRRDPSQGSRWFWAARSSPAAWACASRCSAATSIDRVSSQYSSAATGSPTNREMSAPSSALAAGPT